MSSIKRFQEGPFWAWAITNKDIDVELKIAMNYYQKRHQKRPFLVLCHQTINPKPIDGLQIKQCQFVPKKVFYFATNERET